MRLNIKPGVGAPTVGNPADGLLLALTSLSPRALSWPAHTIAGMTIPTIEDLISSIDSRLRQLHREIEQLGQARAALLNGSAQPEPNVEPKPQRKPRARTRRPQKAEATKPEVVPAGKLLAVLNGSDGHTTAQIAKITNGDANQLLELLKEMEQQGDVKRSGERRATRWHLITDEDRIAERAAEIIERTKKPKRARRS